MIKVGKFLVGFVTADAVLTAFGANKTTYVVIFVTGVALMCVGYVVKRIGQERESVMLRCRLKRKIACSTDQSDHAI